MAENRFESEAQLRKSIAEWGLELYRQGLVMGSGGNISVRLSDGGFLFTPTGWFLGHLTEECLTKTDAEGNLLSGPPPTKETHLHMAAYRMRPEVRAVVHTHSPYATAMACCLKEGDAMPMYTSGLPGKVGRVVTTGYAKSGSVELAEKIQNAIMQTDGLLMENHGAVAVGKTLQAAVSAAYEIESAARLHFITNGTARLLDKNAAESLIEKRRQK